MISDCNNRTLKSVKKKFWRESYKSRCDDPVLLHFPTITSYFYTMVFFCTGMVACVVYQYLIGLMFVFTMVNGSIKKGLAVSPRNFLCDDLNVLNNIAWW